MHTLDGYRGIWFTLGQFSEYGDKYSGGLGTYTANHVPMAVHAPEVEKTFFVYGGVARGDQREPLLLLVSFYDHRAHRVPRPVVVHAKEGINDPHDNPSLAIDDQGHLWVFISGRGRKRPGFRYRSREPFSIDGFDLIDSAEFTYPQPWYFPGRGFFHLFTKYTSRPGGRQLYWQTSDAQGREWSGDTLLGGMDGHYQVSNVRGDRIGTFFNMHPEGNVDRRTNLYYAQTEDFGATWTTVDGRALTLPLAAPDNPALVVDYQAQGKLMYGNDLGFDAQGHPALFYVTSPHARPGPPGGMRDWVVTRWDGRQWHTSRVCSCDHNYDMGSLYLPADDAGEWKIIGPSEPGPQPLQTGGEMCLWTSRDAGANWSRARQITRGSRFNHAYARRPLRASDPFYAFWADGNPLEASESRLYFCDSTGERCWQLPYEMPVEFAEPALMAAGG